VGGPVASTLGHHQNESIKKTTLKPPEHPEHPEHTVPQLAQAYIKANDVYGDASNFWAVEEMMDLPRTHPERAWQTILSVVEQGAPMWVLAVLGAGPLEDLLNSHGVDFIDRVEREAARNRRFYDALSCVYAHACRPESISNRVKAIKHAMRHDS
jgi:hypothetical protein